MALVAPSRPEKKNSYQSTDGPMDQLMDGQTLLLSRLVASYWVERVERESTGLPIQGTRQEEKSAYKGNDFRS